MIVTQSQQQLLQLQQQGQTSPEMQLQSMQLLQQAQALSQTQQALLSEQQRLTTALQQARLQGSMQNMSLQQPVATSTHVVPASQPLQYTKLILRIRDAKGQLKDIKFDFNPSQDTADAIANDLLSAGLLDARNIIVVAANITKILENRSLERVTFPLTLPDLPPESIDEKKLIGFAQISRTTKA
jgi:serine/threonine-protein kinase OSR1/STK39